MLNIQQQLKKLADPMRAAGEKKYLKSPMQHYGATVPQLRKIAKEWNKENSKLSIHEVADKALELWVGEYHEERMVAIFILVFRVQDLTWKEFPVIEKMVRDSTGWAQLDMIAAWLCGELFNKYQSKMTAVMHRWVKDNNFWVRRAAILTLLGPIRQNSSLIKLFEKLTVPLLGEKEFFIRKAIGWVLRELSKKDPDTVLKFVKKYKDQMSGLTYREATRRLPPEYKGRL